MNKISQLEQLKKFTKRISVSPKLIRTNSLKWSLRQRLASWICTFFLASFLSPAVFGQGATVRFAGFSEIGEGGRWTKAAISTILGGEESRYRRFHGRRHLAGHPRSARR